jgi:hypothetical protein
VSDHPLHSDRRRHGHQTQHTPTLNTSQSTLINPKQSPHNPSNEPTPYKTHLTLRIATLPHLTLSEKPCSSGPQGRKGQKQAKKKDALRGPPACLSGATGLVSKQEPEQCIHGNVALAGAGGFAVEREKIDRRAIREPKKRADGIISNHFPSYQYLIGQFIASHSFASFTIDHIDTYDYPHQYYIHLFSWFTISSISYTSIKSINHHQLNPASPSTYQIHIIINHHISFS